MASDLRVVGGKDIEAREARKAARRYAGPLKREWEAELSAQVAAGTLRHLHLALGRELLNYPSADFGYCYAGQRRLGAKLGRCERTVRAAIADMRDLGLLVVKHGGQGRTSSWIFCLKGRPLFDQEATAASGQDRQDLADLARQKVAGLDRQDLADKPYEPQPIELQPIELEPPRPPAHTPGPRAKAAAEIATEIVDRLPADIRKHRLWRSLPSWIDALVDDGFLNTDIIGGVLQSLPSLNDATPSSLKYFEPAITRARDARVSPLPMATVSERAIELALCQQCGVPSGVIAQRLGAERLADLHRRYVEGAMVSALAKEIHDEVRS